MTAQKDITIFVLKDTASGFSGGGCFLVATALGGGGGALDVSMTAVLSKERAMVNCRLAAYHS
jgi:hypothetical protein